MHRRMVAPHSNPFHKFPHNHSLHEAVCWLGLGAAERLDHIVLGALVDSRDGVRRALGSVRGRDDDQEPLSCDDNVCLVAIERLVKVLPDCTYKGANMKSEFQDRATQLRSKCTPSTPRPTGPNECTQEQRLVFLGNDEGKAQSLARYGASGANLCSEPCKKAWDTFLASLPNCTTGSSRPRKDYEDLFKEDQKTCAMLANQTSAPSTTSTSSSVAPQCTNELLNAVLSSPEYAALEASNCKTATVLYCSNDPCLRALENYVKIVPSCISKGTNLKDEVNARVEKRRRSCLSDPNTSVLKDTTPQITAAPSSGATTLGLSVLSIVALATAAAAL